MLTDYQILELYDHLTNQLGEYKKHYQQIKFDCPDCDEGNKKNLECNYKKKVFRCWSCGKKGGVRKLFQKYAPHTIANYPEYFKIDYLGSEIEIERTISLPRNAMPFFKFKDITKYLTIDRGINFEDLCDRKVKFIADSQDKLDNHIYFPFYENRKLVGACVYNVITKKYKNLTPLNFVPYKEFIDKSYPITLTEGVKDCLSSINSIPMLGTDLNIPTLEFLSGCKVILALDSKVKTSHVIEVLEKLEMYNVTEVELFNLDTYEDMNHYYLCDKKSFIKEYEKKFKILLNKE